MSKIFVTSDLHFGHQREFLWSPRGFTSSEEHDAEVIRRWNETVSPDDDVYVLGDLMLSNTEQGMKCMEQLNGKLHLVRGNHDSNARWLLYNTLPNVVEMNDVLRLKYRKYNFYMSHYPTMTGNLEKESLRQMELNLYGHTHQKSNFYQDIPYMYHVGLDSHSCYPVLLDDVIEEMKAKVQECLEML